MAKLVYVVDDDPEVSKTISMILEMSGFATEQFHAPDKLAESLPDLASKPDLLITDFNMPGLNGLELVRLFAAAIPGLKTVIVSGSLSLDELQQHSGPPDAVLPKPFQARALIALAKRLLESPSPPS